MQNKQQYLDIFQVTSSVTQDFELYKNQIVQVSPDKRFKRFNQILFISVFKTVYKAYDAQTGREVCWNSIKFAHIESNERKNILKQIALMKTFSNNNIIKCIESWINKQNKQIIFITQLMNGGTLKNHLKKIKRPKLKIIKIWCKQILSAIKYLHTFHHFQILHKNIKLENLYINTNSNEIKIGELGVYISNSKYYHNPMLSCDAQYEPPELAEGRTNYSSDIYAFGMMLLEIITTKTPYSECASIAQTYKKIINYTKPILLQTIEDPELKKIISNCIDIEIQRPSIKQLIDNPFWNLKNQVDNYQVSLLDEEKIYSMQKSKMQMNQSNYDGISKEIKKNIEICPQMKKYWTNNFLEIYENENQVKIIFNLENKNSFDLLINKEKYPGETLQQFIKVLISKFEQNPQKLSKQDQIIYFCNHDKPETSIFRNHNLQQQNQKLNPDIIKKIKQNFQFMYQDYIQKIQHQFSQQLLNLQEVLDQRFSIEIKELTLIHFSQKELKQKNKVNKEECKIINTLNLPSHSQVLNKLIDILDNQYPQISVIDNSQYIKYQAFKNIMNNGDIAFNDSSIYHTRDELTNNAEFDSNNLRHEFQRLSQDFKHYHNFKIHQDIQQLEKSDTSQLSRIDEVQVETIMKKSFEKNEIKQKIKKQQNNINFSKQID